MANKVDKGFELMYWRLSYRRKFIRTLWMTPFLLGAIILIFVSSLDIVYDVVISIILLAIFLIQLIYNYKKWKRTEK